MVWKEPVAWVGQKTYYDCGIAAVAMVAGVSHRDALSAVFPNRRPRTHQATSYQLAQGLRRLGLRCRLSDHFRVSERNHRVILGFDWIKSVPGQGHFVVWDPVAEKFLDPGYERPWALRNDLYVRGFRRAGVHTRPSLSRGVRAAGGLLLI